MITVWVIDESLDGRAVSGPHLSVFEGKSFAELAPEECGIAIYGGDLVHRHMPEWGEKIPGDGAVIRFIRLPEGSTIGNIIDRIPGIGSPVASIVGAMLNPAGAAVNAASAFFGGAMGFPQRWSPLSGQNILFGQLNFFMGLSNLFGGFGGGPAISPLGLDAPLGSTQGSPSPTYSFGSIGNVTRNNAVVPVVYGEHRVGGPIVRISSVANRDGERLRYTVLLSEGPIARIGKWDSPQNALPSDGNPDGNHWSLELNERPAHTIPGIRIWTRLGFDPQEAVYSETRTRYQYGTVLDQGVSFKHVASRPISGAAIIFRAPGGLFRITDSGGRAFQNTRFRIRFFNEAGQVMSGFTREITLRDNGAVAPFFQTEVFDNLPFGLYTIDVERIGAEQYTRNLRVADKIDMYVVNEIGVYSHPTHQLRATLDIEVLATEDLQGGLPQTTIAVRGRRVYNPVTDTVAWTRNPAWIIRDLMTNGRYGLGGRIDEEEIDDDSFAELADYSDELIPTASGFAQTPQSGDEELSNANLTDGTYTGAPGNWMSLNIGATNIDDWVVVGPATHTGAAAVQIDWKDFEGRAIDTAGSPGWGGISQVLTLSAGVTYRFQVLAKRNPGWSSGNPPRFELDVREGTDVTAGTSLANQIFVAPAGGAGIGGARPFEIQFTPATTGSHVVSIRHAAVASGDDKFHGCFIYTASVREVLPPALTPLATSPLVRITGSSPQPPVITGQWSPTDKWGSWRVEITSVGGGTVGAKWTFIPAPELDLADEEFNTSHSDVSPETIAYGLEAVIDPTLSWSTGTIWRFDLLVEPRNRLDVVLDQRRSGFKWVQDLARTARGVVMRIGSEYVMHVERQRTPVALFTEGGNIIQDTLQVSTASVGNRNNSVEVQFLDASDNYKTGAEVIEDEAVAGQIEDQRRNLVQMPGIVRRSQAARMAGFLHRVDRLQRKAISFEAGLDSVAVIPGRVIKIAYGRQDYAWTGRILGGTISTVILDQEEVTLIAGRAYRYVERTQDGGFQQASFTVAADETTDTLSIAPFDTDPTGNPFCLGVEEEEAELYVVTQVNGAEGLRRRIEGVLYLDEIYSDDGNPVGVGQVEQPVEAAPNHVENLAAVESIDGDTARSLVTISWDEPFPPAENYRVWAFVEGASDWQIVGTVPSGETSFVWDVILPFGTLVDIRVQSVNSGSGADFAAAPEVQIEIENDNGTLRTIPAAPATFTATPGSGSDVTLSWGSVAEADGYEVRAGTWSGGAVIYRGAATSVGVQATREPNRYIVRAFTDDTIYSRGSQQVVTASTALSGYATQASSYEADFDALAAATPNTVVDRWHLDGRAIAQSSPILPAEILTPQTDLGTSAATHVSVEFRALTIPFVAAQDLSAAPWYLSPEGDIDVRLSRAVLTLEHSVNGSTWNTIPFMASGFANERHGTDVVVTARYLRWRVALSAFAVPERDNPDVTEYRGLAAVERLRAAYFRA